MMTKQKEIREGLYDVLKKDILFYPLFAIPTRWLVNKILNYLHSQGCVLKVDRELPQIAPVAMGGAIESITKKAQQDMLKAGYVAVKSLIKEE